MPEPTWRGRSRALALIPAAIVVLVLAAGCGGDDATSTATTTTEAPAEQTTTTAADSTSTTNPEASEAWSLTASDHRTAEGDTFDYDCPAGGTIGSIWGTETYTVDTSVCTAAVHVGLITVAEGGTVTIEIQSGEEEYVAGEANDVISQYYGPYEASFTFPDAPPGSGEFAAPAISWSQTAAGLEIGATRTLECSADGTAGSVWGTGMFTADSSICTAAVLEGLITQADGGAVSVVVSPGADQYLGSEANGVTSQDYPSYDLSFVFSDDELEQ